jgi:hypothetical protein
VNGESIRGTTRTPLPVQAWGESTRKDNSLYLHVFNWPADGKLVVGGLKSDVARAYLLSDAARTPLKFSRTGPLDVSIELPGQAPDKASSVVVVECRSDLAADTVRLLQPGLASDTLRVFDAQLQGRGLSFGPGKRTDAYVLGWTDRNAAVVWSTRLNEPATFEVDVTYDAAANAAGGVFAVEAGGQSLSGTVSAGNQRTASLGRIDLKPGPVELKLVAKELKTGELMRPRTVTLKPVR